MYRNGSILYVSGTKSTQDVWDDLKLPLHKTRLTQRYKDASKHIEDEAVVIDGEKDYGTTDIIGHSLGSAVTAQINQDKDNRFRTRSYGAPHWSNQETKDFGSNLRVSGKGDIVTAFDNAPVTSDTGGGLDPLFRHSFEGMAEVKNKAGNEPLTAEEFMEQFYNES